MSEKKSFLDGKKILAVDDEQDVLETIVDALETAHVDKASNFKTAEKKIAENRYDLAILDIMGVDGLTLLEQTVNKGIPTVMLTAHAMNVETLMTSIKKGAISFLPKEKLADLDIILEDMLKAMHNGEPTWKILFDELEGFFNEKFGPGWKEKDKDFWLEFQKRSYVSKGIQSRLMHDEKVLSHGI